MTGTVQTPAASEPAAPGRRSALPPWQVALGFLLLVCGRFINSQLWFSMGADNGISVANTSFLLIIATFWFWPWVASDDPLRSAILWLRWWSLAALICFAPQAFGISAYHPHDTRPGVLLVDLSFGIYSAALIYPFPWLFAELRLDRSLPASLALGPCALFFFYALMVPALVESVQPGSSSYLLWIKLVVPPITGVLVWLDLRERAAGLGWRRALAKLLWKTALLPFLFLLGEAGVVYIGTASWP